MKVRVYQIFKGNGGYSYSTTSNRPNGTWNNEMGYGLCNAFAAVSTAGGEIVTPEVAVSWGAFLQTVVDFVIIAFCIFVMVKFIMNLKRKKEELPAPVVPAEPTEEVKLLTQIRDLLEKENNK